MKKINVRICGVLIVLFACVSTSVSAEDSSGKLQITKTSAGTTSSKDVFSSVTSLEPTHDPIKVTGQLNGHEVTRRYYSAGPGALIMTCDNSSSSGPSLAVTYSIISGKKIYESCKWIPRIDHNNPVSR